MRLITCKKCGTQVVTNGTLVEKMFDALSEVNEKAKKSQGHLRNVYILEA